MGYYSGWSSRAELIEHLGKTEDNGAYRQEVIARAFTGNDLWSVVEVTRQLGPGVKHIFRYIRLDKLSCHKEGRSMNWGYKPLEEQMHPYTYNCPLKLLDMVPAYCHEWRAKVRLYWYRRREKEAERRTAKLYSRFMAGRL